MVTTSKRRDAVCTLEYGKVGPVVPQVPLTVRPRNRPEVMETDNELTSGTTTLTGTEETVGSSELNADEAEAITRSMDLSIAFWGTSKEPPEKIPATRLKCPIKRPGKASNVALKIWEKMTQKDLDKVKEIEVSLMTEGEIGTLDLFNALKYIIESTGMEFEEMLKSVDDDPIESTISLTNEILHIFNLNEPPEIIEDEEYGHYIHYNPISNAHKQHEQQRKDITNKMKILINKAHQMGIHDVRIPSSPYLSERSKLTLIEKQISSKMKLRNLKKIFQDSSRGCLSDCSLGESKVCHSHRYQKKKSSHQKKDSKRLTLAERPKFRPVVKPESLRYEDLFKQTPDINKRIRKVREMRKKFMEKSKNNTEGKSCSNFYNIRNSRNRHLATPYNNYSNYGISYKGRTPRVHRRGHLPYIHNSRVRDFKLDESRTRVFMGSTDDDMLQNEDDFRQATSILQRNNSRDEMLYEMKKMVNEAVQAVSESNHLKHSLGMAGGTKTFKIKAKERKRQSKTRVNDMSRAMQTTTNALKFKDENCSPFQEKEKDATVVTVKQEAGLENLHKDEKKVSTEVKVCGGSFSGPGLKVSVVSKVSSNEEVEESPRPKSRKDIREAISILKEYIALKNNENLSRMSLRRGEDTSFMLTCSEDLFKEKNIPSESVAKTEVTIEPSCQDTVTNEESSELESTEEDGGTKLNEYKTGWNANKEEIDKETDQTFQTYAVTMLMPMISAGEEPRFYSPFQFGGMFINRPTNVVLADQDGDVNDNGWSSWDSPIWQSVPLGDGFSSTVRNESDSLYVNTSEEQVNYSGVGEAADDNYLVQQPIETTVSTISVVIVDNDDEISESESDASMMSSITSGLYRFIINSVMGVVGIFFKPFSIIMAAFKIGRNENGQ